MEVSSGRNVTAKTKKPNKIKSNKINKKKMPNQLT